MPSERSPWILARAALVGTVLGLAGYWAGSQLGSDNPGILLGYLLGAVGFLWALGFGSELLLRLRGRPAGQLQIQLQGPRWQRYLLPSTDHKVVGLQFGALALLVGLLWLLIGLR